MTAPRRDSAQCPDADLRVDPVADLRVDLPAAPIRRAIARLAHGSAVCRTAILPRSPRHIEVRR
jgi:hypothetical protein